MHAVAFPIRRCTMEAQKRSTENTGAATPPDNDAGPTLSVSGIEVKNLPRWFFGVAVLIFAVLLVISFFTGRSITWSPFGFDKREPILSAGADATILSGRVSPNGKASANGVRAKRLSKGEYLLDFAKPYLTPPVVVVTIIAAERYRGAGGSSPADTTVNVLADENQATVWTYDIDKDGHAVSIDVEFGFIVIG